jgi:hypothetical protein
VRPLGLTEDEKRALMAFLRALRSARGGAAPVRRRRAADLEDAEIRNHQQPDRHPDEYR